LIVILTFIIITIFVFKNPLYYTISLLIVSLLVLSYLSLHTYLTFLTAFILVIVYVGAIIVLIGYICAISPNLVVEPDYGIVYFFVVLLPLFYLFNYLNISYFSLTTFTIVDYFYSYQGVIIFIVLITILFVTLLIVTSQYSVPKGPFRSIIV
jgi:hypothetical protein